jgi:predicted Na+-dependent transporter
VPGHEILLGGQTLRRWTEQEVSRVTRALAWASICCLLGVVLVVGALIVAWVTTSAATHMVEVRTKFHVVCGDLILADRQQVSIRTKANGTVYVPQMAIENMKPVRVCDTTP